MGGRLFTWRAIVGMLVGSSFCSSWDSDHSWLGRAGIRFRIVIQDPCLKGEASKANSDEVQVEGEERWSGHEMGTQAHWNFKGGTRK